MVWNARFWAVVGLALLSGPAWADLRPIAEAPPVGFKGEQYIDSRGCVFMRAGGGDTQVSWVARVSADRKQMCGARPSLSRAAAPVAEVAEVSSPKPQAAEPKAGAVVAKAASKPHPMLEVPRGTSLGPKPKVEAQVEPRLVEPIPVVARAAAPKPNATSAPPEASVQGLRDMGQTGAQTPLPDAGRVARAAPASAPPPAPPLARAQSSVEGGYSCPPARPVLQRMQMRSGETFYLCARQAGDLSDAVAPLVSGGGRSSAMQVVANFPEPPAGYRRAWTDDRLNPYRGASVSP